MTLQSTRLVKRRARRISDSSEAVGQSPVPELGYDVWLIAGQSNAVFFSHFYNASLDPTNSRIQQLPATGLPLILAAEPLSHPAQGVTQPGIGISFPLAFARLYVASIVANRQVILVPYAKQGTGFSDGSWLAGNPGGTFYEAAVSQANIAMATNVNNVFAGVLLHLGEDDVQAGTSGPIFKGHLINLVAGFRARITGATNSAFISGEMVPSWWAANGGAAIAAVTADMPNYISQCGYWAGATNGTDNSANGAPYNTVHYNAAGQRLNGAAAYQAYLNRSQ